MHQLFGSVVVDPTLDPQLPDGNLKHKPPDVTPDKPFVVEIKRFVGEWTPLVDDEVREVPFGFSGGNWGQIKHDSVRYRYMLSDIHESPGHVWALQEVSWDMCQDLINANDTNRVRNSDETNVNQHNPPQRPNGSLSEDMSQAQPSW